MKIDYNRYKGGGDYVYLPKIGQEKTYVIKRLYFGKAKDNKFNFSKKEKVELGNGEYAEKTVPILDDNGFPFNLQAELGDGKTLSCNSWGAFQEVFVKNDVQDGDTITVKHLDRGAWKVSKNGEVKKEDIPVVEDSNDEDQIPF